MNPPQNNRLAWLAPSMDDLEQQGLRRVLREYSGTQGAQIVLEGRELINFGSNDYLALAADARLRQAVIDAAQECAWGSGASPLICGRSAKHAQLERELAKFEGTEAALLFSSGYAANVGTITSLAGREDAIFGDAKNHASIIDGCRLSRATVHIYPHNDMRALERLLEQSAGSRRRLIVTDSLFSMDGDLAPLADLAELADKYDAMLMIDEAHATGVLGAEGRGAAEHFSVEDAIDVRVGTLSKALGGSGGFVAGSRTLIDWLSNKARTYVFSTAFPAASCAASIAALQAVREEPQRGGELLIRAQQLRSQLREQGWRVGSSQSQIIPVVVGQEVQTMQLAERLLEAGIFVPGIRPPSVPAGESLLRITLTWGHSQQMIGRLTEALAAAR